MKKLNSVWGKINHWWETQGKPKLIRIDRTKDYLEGRLVYCANCNINRALFRYQGRLVCDVCCSDNWEYPTPMRIVFDKDIEAKVLGKSGKQTA